MGYVKPQGRELAMDGLVILFALVAALVALDFAAIHAGVDARDSVDDEPPAPFSA